MDKQLDVDQRSQVHDAARRLHVEFAGTFSEETIEGVLDDSLDRLVQRASYTTFVPMLAERFATERLRMAAKSAGEGPHSDRPTVLFLCVQNAGRSQMAAGWLRHLAGDRVDVLSGGSKPGEQINPVAVETMAEVGIDIANAYPKPWTEETLGAADVVVTMGCGDACPVVTGVRYLDWELADPAGRPLEEVRAVRDDIRARVEGLLAELDVTPVVA